MLHKSTDNSTGNEYVIGVLSDVTTQLNRYLGIIIFLFGVVGNLLNIVVLSQRSFRSNSCAWLFLALSVVNLTSIISGLITIIVGGWTTNPTNYITWICKLRAFLVFSTRTMAAWLIVLATFDRWLLSCIDVRRRQLSSLKNAQRGTFLIVIFSILLYAQMLYCYEANRIDTPLKCYGKTSACRVATDISFATLTILGPLCLMTVFGLLTIINVRQSQRRVQTLTLANGGTENTNRSSGIASRNSERKTKKRADQNLLRMLLVQVAILIIFTLPLSLDKFYSSFSEEGSALAYDINAFVYDVAILSYFVSNGMPFYVYTLCGGTVFRKACIDFFVFMKQKIMCQ